MNFSFELPEGTMVMNRRDLKQTLEEMLTEIQDENSEKEIMTIKQTADYLKVSVPTVRSMISNNEIPFFQRGQVIRLYRKDINEWIRRNSKKGGGKNNERK